MQFFHSIVGQRFSHPERAGAIENSNYGDKVYRLLFLGLAMLVSVFAFAQPAQPATPPDIAAEWNLQTHNAAIAAMADRVIRISSGSIVEIQRNVVRASTRDLSW